jgi:hypothetical protein
LHGRTGGRKSSGEDGGVGVPGSASSTVAPCSSSSFPLGLYCVSPGNCSGSGLIPALSTLAVAAPRTHSLWWQHLVLVLDMHGSGRGSGRGSGILCIRFCKFCIWFYRFCLLGASSIGSCSGHQSGSVARSRSPSGRQQWRRPSRTRGRQRRTPWPCSCRVEERAPSVKDEEDKK